MERWSDATYQNRAADIRAVLDAVLGSPSFQGLPVGARRVGIAGHSLGGYTGLGIGGAWPAWKDDRIKAVLALSPYSSPYVSKGELEQTHVPVMYQPGTLDLRKGEATHGCARRHVERASRAACRSSCNRVFELH